MSESSFLKTTPSFFSAFQWHIFSSFQYLTYTFSEFQICHASPRVLFCVSSRKPCKWWSEKSCAYVEKKFWNVKTVLKGQLYDETLWGWHLHFWRVLFQHLLFNTNLSWIWPHSCKLSSHVIIGTVLSQVWFETLLQKVRKKRRRHNLEAKFCRCRNESYLFLFLSLLFFFSAWIGTFITDKWSGESLLHCFWSVAF